MLEATLLQLVIACAPNVSADTLLTIARHESGLNEYAVHVNAPTDEFLYKIPKDRDSALTVARAAMQQGYSVDVGLMQVNSQHFDRFGVSIADVFEPCTNVRMGATVLTENYIEAVRVYGQTDQALLAALSAYNTGDFSRGLENGYVAKLLAARRTP